MEELRKEGRGESQKEGSPAQRPVEGEEGKGREGEGLVEGAVRRGGGRSHMSPRRSARREQRSQSRRRRRKSTTSKKRR